MSNEPPAERPGSTKVLVIDDSNQIPRSAEVFLKQGGYDGLLADAGCEGQSRVNGQDPHLHFGH